MVWSSLIWPRGRSVGSPTLSKLQTTLPIRARNAEVEKKAGNRRKIATKGDPSVHMGRRFRIQRLAETDRLSAAATCQLQYSVHVQRESGTAQQEHYGR